MNQRIPVAISLNQGTIVTTGGSSRFAPGNTGEALENYLRLVRQMRSQRRDREVHIRQRDVDAIAVDLRMSPEQVVDELCSLMQVTRSQLPVVAGVAVAAVAVVALGAVALPRVIESVSGTEPVPQTNSNVSNQDGLSTSNKSLGSSTGVLIGPDGVETPVSLGGAPIPEPQP